MTKLKRQVQMCFLIAAFAALNRLAQSQEGKKLMLYITLALITSTVWDESYSDATKQILQLPSTSKR